MKSYCLTIDLKLLKFRGNHDQWSESIKSQPAKELKLGAAHIFDHPHSYLQGRTRSLY